MKITVRCGPNTADLDIDVGDNSEVSSDAPRLLGELKEAIAASNGLDPDHVRMIHASKTLNKPPETPLSDLGFKEGDKVLVMGKPLKADPGFNLLVDFEKQNLVGMQDTFEKIGTDLTDLEKNFLEGAQRDEMIRRMDKRIKMFNEIGIRHLEALDGMSIIKEDTVAAQATRNREKRKALVNGINHYLNLNEKYGVRLDEYRRHIAGEDGSGKL